MRVKMRPHSFDRAYAQATEIKQNLKDDHKKIQSNTDYIILSMTLCHCDSYSLKFFERFSIERLSNDNRDQLKFSKKKSNDKI